MENNVFADILREKIIAGDKEFMIPDSSENVYFYRFNQGRFDTLMTGDIWRNSPSIMKEMKPFGVVVNGKFYAFEANAYLRSVDSVELSPQNKEFFRNDLHNVAKEIVLKVKAKANALLAPMTEKDIPLPRLTKGDIIEQTNISGYIARGEEPTFGLPNVVHFYDENMSAIDYLLDGDAAINKIFDDILANEDLSGTLYRSYFHYLVEKRLYAEKVNNLSPTEKATQAINAALAKAVEEGSQSVRIFILGDDSYLNKYRLKDYPDFSIAGKEIIGKMSPRINCRMEGIPPYQFSIENMKLKDRYGNRNIDYLEKIPSLSVKKIMFGRKVLYEKGN